MSTIPLRSARIPHSALPVNHADELDWLRLYRSHRVGPVTFIRLVREHGSVAAALDVLPSVAATSGVAGYQPMPRESAEIDEDLVRGFLLNAYRELYRRAFEINDFNSALSSLRAFERVTLN